MKSFGLILEALRKGSELANVETWKKTGVALAILVSVLTLLSEAAVLQGWVGGPVSPEIISELSAAIVAVVGLFLAYLQVATTKRVGVGGKNPENERGVVNEEVKEEDGGDHNPRDSGAGVLPEELIKNRGREDVQIAAGVERPPLTK